ncbi:hypothetical protein T4C_5 [Trichinella pseudospiralis]|uniref:Uncharacterized protein n=1 Tax=Trichinella pseudospiralis TaxID=6337 RepID=A0A0V1KAA5_TRIPS|nr:hypothetical protein T4C_5 [Trichinella pseudospiralis]
MKNRQVFLLQVVHAVKADMGQKLYHETPYSSRKLLDVYGHRYKYIRYKSSEATLQKKLQLINR